MEYLVDNCTENDTRHIFNRYENHIQLYNKFTIKLIVENVCIPIWFLFGLPGAVMSLLLWSRMPIYRHQPSIRYLAILSAVDIMFFLVHLIWHFESAYNFHSISNVAMCRLYPFLNILLQQMTPLLTLAFTIDRYFTICRPEFCNSAFFNVKMHTIKICATLCFLSVLLALPQIFFFEFTAGKCLALPDLPPHNHWHFMFWYNLVVEVFVFGVIPLAIFCLNIFVMKNVWRLMWSSRQGPQSSQQRSLQLRSLTTTVTLLSVSGYFIVATIPSTIVHLAMYVLPDGDLCLTDKDILENPVWTYQFRFFNIKVIVDMITLTHYAANFYIYLITSKEFRYRLLKFKRFRKTNLIKRLNLYT